MMTVYAIANQKGGVGKTTVSLGLASALAHKGHAVLLIDADPQHGASRLLGYEAHDESLRTLADLLLSNERRPLTDVVVTVPWGFDFVASDLRLARFELQRRPGDDMALRAALKASGELPYEYVLIDCPPQLGGLTTASLAAAHRLVMVTEPSYVAFKALDDLLKVYDLVRERLNETLSLSGVVLNTADNTRESRERVKELRERFGEQAWEPHIPRRAAIRETYGEGRSLHDPAASREARQAGDLFLDLARHLEED